MQVMRCARAAALVLVSIGFFGLAPSIPATNRPLYTADVSVTNQKLLVGEWLYVCSPFKSLDGRRALDFSARGRSVTMIGIFNAVHPTVARPRHVITGTWKANSISHITISFRSPHIMDTLDTTMNSSSDECILAAEDASSANLEGLWIGGPLSIKPVP